MLFLFINTHVVHTMNTYLLLVYIYIIFLCQSMGICFIGSRNFQSFIEHVSIIFQSRYDVTYTVMLSKPVMLCEGLLGSCCQ